MARLAAGSTLCMLLAGCSMFPATLTMMSAQRDLSSIIASGTGSNYGVFPVTSGSTSLVILLSRDSSIDPTVVVLDSGLNLVRTYTRSELDALGLGTFNGSQVMVDFDGLIDVGNFRFTAADLQYGTVTSSSDLVVNLYNPSFSSTAYARAFTNCNAGSANTFSCSPYDSSWSSLTSISASISSGSSASYYLRNVFNVDDTSGTGAVVLVLSTSDSEEATFVRVNLVDFYNLSLSSPLLSSYTTATIDNLDSDSISFAGDCIVAYSWNEKALVRYSTTDFSKLGSLSIGDQRNDTLWAFCADGSYAVEFDRTNRVISKVAKWW